MRARVKSTGKRVLKNVVRSSEIITPAFPLQHDHLMTECTYNASGKMSFTRGGFSSTSEMCLVFLESVHQS